MATSPSTNSGPKVIDNRPSSQQALKQFRIFNLSNVALSVPIVVVGETAKKGMDEVFIQPNSSAKPPLGYTVELDWLRAHPQVNVREVE